MLKFVQRQWHQYKYRFVPWLAVNLQRSSPRVVPSPESDRIIAYDVVEHKLSELFREFERNTAPHQDVCNLYRGRMEAMYNVFGFTVERRPSSLEFGGRGVFIASGHVAQGSIVSMYPGVVYQPWEPVFFVSLRNPFLFRCQDGVHIDGKDTGLSKMMYNSCSKRDRILGEYMCDTSWLTEQILNPLAVGQYVNNQNKEFPANVAYQEFDVPANFPHKWMKYLPNIEAKQDREMETYLQSKLLRTVVLVAVRDIHVDEELFSTYFTIVQGKTTQTTG